MDKFNVFGYLVETDGSLLKASPSDSECEKKIEVTKGVIEKAREIMNGEPSIILGVDYLVQILEELSCDRAVKIFVTDAQAVLQGADSDGFFVLMPMRGGIK